MRWQRRLRNSPPPSTQRRPHDDTRPTLSRRLRGGEAAAGGRRHQRLRRAHGRAGGLPCALLERRRGGQRLLRPSRPWHDVPERRACRRAAHHRGHRPAAVGGHRHRLGRRLQHRPQHPRDDPRRRRCRSHRRPSVRQALRASTEQGHRADGRDVRPHQGGGGCEDRSRLRGDGAHRRAGGGGARRHAGARGAVRGSRRRRHLRRGHDGPRHVRAGGGCGAGAGAGQSHGVRPDPALLPRRAAPGWC